jgi:uncharacterized protein (DUF1778 family)
VTTTKAQQKANRKWNENNLERIYLTVKKGQKSIIENAAKQNNQSVNAFINQAITEKIESIDH